MATDSLCASGGREGKGLSNSVVFNPTTPRPAKNTTFKSSENPAAINHK